MPQCRYKWVRKFILWAVSLFTLLAACAPIPIQSPDSNQTVGTVVALTFAALTPAAPAPVLTQIPGGLPVSYQNVTFTVPLELNASVVPSTTDDVEFPYINPSNGPMPEHAAFSFTNYPVGSGEIRVFKASEYAAYSKILQDTVTALLSGQDTAQPLPDVLIEGHFYAQAKAVSFKNGHGVRYLTQSMTAPVPINNEGLLYYYQGITTDGAYFVSATFGVKAAFLAANSNPNSGIPPDGVPFGNGADFDYSAYLKAVTQKLNDTSAGSYVPSLLTLDKIIESLQISTP